MRALTLVLFVVIVALPMSANAFSVGGRRSQMGQVVFSGSLAVEAAKRKSRDETSRSLVAQTSEQSTLRETLRVDARGYIWDPRFLVFDSGVSRSYDWSDVGSGGNSKSRLNGYHAELMFMPRWRHPLVFLASRSTTTAISYRGPAFELLATTYGARWGLDYEILGTIRLGYDRGRSVSDSVGNARSNGDDSFFLDGRRRIKSRRWGESELEYRFNREISNDYLSGSMQRRDVFFLGDQSNFGDRVRLRVNANYRDSLYRRRDASGLNQASASGLFSVSGALSIANPDQIGYAGSFGLTDFNAPGTQSSSYNFGGSLDHRLNTHWRSNAGATWSSSRTSTNGDVYEESSGNLGGGVSYTSLWGNYSVFGGYGFGLAGTVSESSRGLSRNHGVSHALNAGYSRRISARYADSLDFGVKMSSGLTDSNEQNIRYGLSGRVTPDDAVQGRVEIRQSSGSSAVGGGQVSSRHESSGQSVSASWVHRFSRSSVLNVSAGLTESINRTETRTSRASVSKSEYLSGTMSAQPFRFVQWSGSASFSRSRGAASHAGRKVEVNSRLSSNIGKWQAGVDYRYRRADDEPDDTFEDQSVKIMLRRSF